MNNCLLKISGLAVLLLSLQTYGFAQQTGEVKDTAGNHFGSYDEIIIKRKGDKDAKVVVEIRDGQVFVNGKPAAEYQDDNLSVRKKSVKILDGQTFTFNNGDGDIELPPMPPMELQGFDMPMQGNGGNHYKKMLISTNKAFLGVTSEKSADGEGAKVTNISIGSAAEKAGLKAGDILTRVDEIPVTDQASLSEAIHKYKPQDKVTLTFKRDGKEKKLTVTLGKSSQSGTFNMPDMQHFFFQMPDQGMDGKGFGAGPKLGISAQDTEDGKGVKVLGVADQSAAEKAGVKEGDIITLFDGKEVSNAPDLAEKALDSRDKHAVKVNILRNGKPMELEIKVPHKLKTANL